MDYLISKVASYVSSGALHHVRIEFPATLVPLRPGVYADDDMVVMEFFDDGLAKIAYTDFQSEERDPSWKDWILFDRHGRRAYAVLFDDECDEVILSAKLSKKNPPSADDLEELENLVMDFENL